MGSTWGAQREKGTGKSVHTVIEDVDCGPEPIEESFIVRERLSKVYQYVQSAGTSAGRSGAGMDGIIMARK